MTFEEWVVFILFTIAINLILQTIAWKLSFWIGKKKVDRKKGGAE